MFSRVIYVPESSSSSSSSDSSGLEFLNHVVAAAAEVEDTARSTRRYVDRDRVNALEVLMKDYFVERPQFNEEVFRSRFRMSKSLFLKIVDDINDNFEWFQVGHDARMKQSFTALQKCTSAIRQLATGNIPDSYDEYLCMSTRTSRECLEYFCNAIVILYGKEYLRAPTSHDISLLYQAHGDRHGIPGMLGSIDCTHWVWRNCPTRLRGQYHRGDHHYPTIILEAVASHDLWFWHAYFGVAGSNNDINVLNQSPLFTNELHGTAPRCPFYINGHQYKRGYYLADGIYPSWSTFVKSFSYPTDVNQKMFKKLQESARKDVERAFGVLKSKWATIARPARPMKIEKLKNMMYACIIMHNMILKDDGKAISPVHITDPPVNQVVGDNIIMELRDEATHFKLKFDLTEHVASHLNISKDALDRKGTSGVSASLDTYIRGPINR